jgi:hypothetical protein
MLDFKSICALARCNRRLKGDAASRFALATQDRLVVTIHFSELGLIQYHPDIYIKGQWKDLEKFPALLSRCAANLEIIGLFDNVEKIEQIFGYSKSKIRELTLSNGVIRSKIAIRLFKALHERERSNEAPGLRALYFHKESLSNRVLDALAIYIADTRSLEELTFYNSTFKLSEIKSLEDGLLKNRSITSLEFTGPAFHRNFEVAMSRVLRGCPTLLLFSLRTSYKQYGDWNLETIADAIMDNNCNLQWLCINNRTLSNKELVALSSSITKLHGLRACFGEISGEDLQVLGHAIGASKTITCISLSYANRSEIGTEFLLNMTANKSLQVIDLLGCGIGTQGLFHLKEAVIGKTELREINLTCNNVDDSGCRYIAEIIAECPSLEILHLDWNGIKSTGIRAIAAALLLSKSLQKLYLRGTRLIDDASASVLFTAVKDHPSLLHIILSMQDNRFHIGELATPVLESLKAGVVKIEGKIDLI